MRSLADDLRGRTDDELSALLAARPDLAHPVPADLGALAQRATSQASIAHVLRGCDEATLQVLLLCALAPEPLRVTDLTAALVTAAQGSLSASAARALVGEALDRFHREALIWGTPRSLRLVGPVRDLVVPPGRGPLVAGIDPVVAGFVRTPSVLDTVVADLPAGARQALDRLLARPLVGVVADARRTPDPDRSPVDRLLAEHLVIPFGADHVVVPGEVAVLLESGPRAGLRIPTLERPRPQRRVADPARAEAGAVGATVDDLNTLDELGHRWADAPPARLRSGGISAREVTRTARELGVTEPRLCLLIEVAAAAGLIGTDSREGSTVLPTAAFDLWRAASPAQRHARLLMAWREMPRVPAGDDARPLSEELAAPHLPALRREVLAALAEDAGDWTDDELLDVLRWRAPLLDWDSRRADVLTVLTQLRELGVLANGWLTPAGRALVPPDEGWTHPGRPGPVSGGSPTDGGEADLVEALERTLPGLVDALVLQADLTAVVPGLPTPALADLLRLAARAESRGAASVYRFSPESIRRALDDEWSASSLLAELGRFGPVPQPLEYLVNDVARTHALLRVGALTCYLRCDDPATLAGILADPRTAGLGLFSLSDTIAGSDQSPEHVLEELRSMGLHPVPDPGRGLTIAPVRRARVRPAPQPAGPAMTPALAAAAIRAMRAGDGEAPDAPPSASRRPAVGSARVGTAASGDGAGADSEEAQAAPVSPLERLMAALREAIDTEQPVLLDYATSAGISTSVQVQPLQLNRGYLTGQDLLTQRIETYSAARIGSLLAIDGVG